MDPSTETHAAGHSILAWLKPDKNPFYLITLGSVFTLTYIAKHEEFRNTNWNIAFWLVGITLLVNIALSLFPQEINNDEYNENLFFARTIGITSAIISLIFLSDATKNGSILWMFLLIFIQILTFSIYLFSATLNKKKNISQEKKKINNFQLCMTTSMLLMGLMINFSLSSKIIDKNETFEIVDKNKKDNINAFIRTINIYFEKITKNISFTDKSNRGIISTMDSSDYYTNIIIIKKSLDQLANITSDKTSFENKPLENKPKKVVKLLLLSWIICMIIWIYQLRTVFNFSSKANTPSKKVQDPS